MLKDGCGRRRTPCKRNCNTKGRQARFFTAVNQSSSSILTPHAEVGQPRMPLHTSKWRRAHNASYWPDHKLAQDNGRAFWQNISIAIHTELRHTCRLLFQSGPKESGRCRRRNSVPKRDVRTKRSAASRIESITLSTGRPVADHSSG